MLKLFNFQSTLLEKKQLTEKDYLLKYSVPSDFNFTPGQFAGLRVNPRHTRAYSIVDIKDGAAEFLIDISPGGIASQYFETCKVGDTLTFLGPYGRYFLKETDFNKVFIATSTGIAPFIPMVRSIFANGAIPTFNIKFLFGVGLEKHDIAINYLDEFVGKNFEYFRCITREEPSDAFSKKGRITQVLPEVVTDYRNTEFYICGSNDMIVDVQNILLNNGADKIYFEKFG
jgi:all-trans-retinol 13,14-reductase